MSEPRSRYEVGLAAYREMTTGDGDSAATRVRVLARARPETKTRAWTRTTALGALLVAVTSVSASAAWTYARHWQSPRRMELNGPQASPASSSLDVRLERGPIRTIPSLGDPVKDRDTAAEDRLYRLAHRAHFLDDAPARALRAWDTYLEAFPSGRFVPEARYNKALCLVRLARLAEATRELRAFARDSSGYRHEEVERILTWIEANWIVQ